MKAVFVVNWDTSLLVDKVLSVIVLVRVLSVVKLLVMCEVSTGKSVGSLRLSSNHFSWLALVWLQ